jgi:hypothetical protein
MKNIFPLLEKYSLNQMKKIEKKALQEAIQVESSNP